MAQKKSHEVDGWLARPDPRATIVLIYGPDRGLVSERARAFIKATGLSADDPFAVVRLQSDDVEGDPGRIADELLTVPMFSDRRLVWLQANNPGKGVSDAIKALAGTPPRDAVLLIEAGDLKKGVGVRALVEGAASGMALPCYADEGRALDQVIDQALEAANLTMSFDARQAFKRNLGGDRLASRSEIDKLVLYAQSDGQVTVNHVEALSGDASGPSLDQVVDAVLMGRADDFDSAFRKAVAGGQIATLLSSALRQFQIIDVLRDQVESGGKTAAAAVAGARPPIFFSRRETVEKAVARWTRPMIDSALERLARTVLASRERSHLAVPIVRQALLGLALESARTAKGR